MTRISTSLLGLATLAALGLAARPAAAQDTLYTTQGDFFTAVFSDAAINSVTTDTFNGLGDNASDFTYEGQSFTNDGLTFTTGGDLFVTAPAYAPTTYQYGTEDVLVAAYDPSGTTKLSIALPTDTLAIGFDLGDVDETVPFTVNLADGQSFSVQGGNPSGGFKYAGFVSNGPAITSLTVFEPNGTEGAPSYDNVTYGVGTPGPSPTPEPSGFVGLGIGLLGLGALAVKARRRVA